MKLVISDSFGVKLEFPSSGPALASQLKLLGIPTSACIFRLGQREVLLPELANLKPNDEVQVRVVGRFGIRAYRWLETLPLRRERVGDGSPYYSRRFMTIGGSSKIQTIVTEFDRPSFVEYFERTLIEVVREWGAISDGDKVVLGLSGGVDSMALALALSRVKKRLPTHKIIPVLADMSTTNERIPISHVKKLANQLGEDLVVVTQREITKRFGTSLPWSELILKISRAGNPAIRYQIPTLHGYTMRITLEGVAERFGARKIMFGITAEDIACIQLGAITTGYATEPVPVRSVGPFKEIFPLYRFTSKESYLYVYATAKDFLSRAARPASQAETPSALYYVMVKHMEEIWPGFLQHVVIAASRAKRNQPRVSYRSCGRCKGLHISDTQRPNSVCGMCNILRELGIAKS